MTLELTITTLAVVTVTFTHKLSWITDHSVKISDDCKILYL